MRKEQYIAEQLADKIIKDKGLTGSFYVADIVLLAEQYKERLIDIEDWEKNYNYEIELLYKKDDHLSKKITELENLLQYRKDVATLLKEEK